MPRVRHYDEHLHNRNVGRSTGVTTAFAGCRGDARFVGDYYRLRDSGLNENAKAVHLGESLGVVEMKKLQELFAAALGKAAKVGAGVGAMAVSGMALAQTGPDTSAATTAFTQVGTAIGAIGAAMVLAASAGIVYRWVTAFLVK